MQVSIFSRLLVLLAVVSVAACGAQEPADPKLVAEEPVLFDAPTEREALVTDPLPASMLGRWELVAIDGQPPTAAANAPFILLAEDGTVGGVGGVNRFNTQVTVTGGSLSFGLAAMTKMAGPPEAMQLEDLFMARLGAVGTFEIDGSTLRMWAGDNEALTFAREMP